MKGNDLPHPFHIAFIVCLHPILTYQPSSVPKLTKAGPNFLCPCLKDHYPRSEPSKRMPTSQRLRLFRLDCSQRCHLSKLTTEVHIRFRYDKSPTNFSVRKFKRQATISCALASRPSPFSIAPNCYKFQQLSRSVSFAKSKSEQDFVSFQQRCHHRSPRHLSRNAP